MSKEAHKSRTGAGDGGDTPKEQFLKVSRGLLVRQDLGAGEKLLLAQIADQLSRGRGKYLGVRTLAVDLGIDKSSVIRAFLRLEKCGVLKIERPGNGKRSHYTVDLKSVRKTLPVAKRDRSQNAPQSVRKTRTEAYAKRVHTKNRQPRQRRAPQKAAKVEIPDTLNTPDFCQAWADWQQHRQEAKKPLTPTTAKRQLSTLAKHGAEKAAAMINRSIERGWTGVWPLKDDGCGGKGDDRPDAWVSALTGEELAKALGTRKVSEAEARNALELPA